MKVIKKIHKWQSPIRGVPWSIAVVRRFFCESCSYLVLVIKSTGVIQSGKVSLCYEFSLLWLSLVGKEGGLHCVLWHLSVLIVIIISVTAIYGKSRKRSKYWSPLEILRFHFCPSSAMIELNRRSMFHSVEKALQVRITKGLAVK